MTCRRLRTASATRNEYSPGIQDAPEFRERPVPNQIENNLVALAAGREILTGVVNHLLCADSAHKIHVACAANARDLSAHPLGNLHRKYAHAPRRAVNQDCLPRLNLPFVSKGLERRESPDRNRGRLLVSHVLRFQCDERLRGRYIFSKCPVDCAEHTVSPLQTPHPAAGRTRHFQFCGNVCAESRTFWLL